MQRKIHDVAEKQSEMLRQILDNKKWNISEVKPTERVKLTGWQRTSVTRFINIKLIQIIYV